MASEEIFKLSEENGEDSVDIIGYSQKLAESIENALKNKVSSNELKTEIKKQDDKNTAQDKNIQSLYNISPKVKLQGTSFHIPDSAEAPMKISPRGNDIEQETREGYNKVNLRTYILKNCTLNEITNTSIKVTASSLTNDCGVMFGPFSLKTDTTYTVKLLSELNNGDGTYGSVELYKNDTSTWYKSLGAIKEGTFTVDEETEYYLRLLVSRKNTGTVLNTITFSNLIIYEGTESKPYEQYGAMPSFEFPSPVKHVGGKVKSYNLFDKAAIKQGYYVGSTGGVTAQEGVNLSDYIAVKPNSTYHIGDRGAWASVGLYNENKEYIERPSISTGAYTTNENTYFIRCNIESGYEDTFQIIEGTSSKPYLPYGDIGSVYDIEKESENMLPILFSNGTKAGVTLTIKEDGNILLNGTATSYAVFDAIFQNEISLKDYILRAKQKSGIISSGNVQFLLLTKDYSLNQNVNLTPEISNVQATLNSNSYAVERITIPTGTVLNNVEIHFSISKEQENKSLDLTNLPLYSKNDYIYKIGDKWFVHNFVDKYIFTGNETYTKSASSDDEHFCGYITGATQIQKFPTSNKQNYGASNMLKYGLYSSTNLEECLSWGTQMHIKVLASRLSSNSAEGLQEFLKGLYDAGTPLYAICELLTPTETEIIDETVIEVCEALLNGYAYDEVTNISVDNPILSAPLVLDVEYYIKTALGLETKVSYEEYAKLLKRVEQLEAQIGG